MGATAMGVVYSATIPAVAANPSTYRELAIFGDVFERFASFFMAS